MSDNPFDNVFQAPNTQTPVEIPPPPEAIAQTGNQQVAHQDINPFDNASPLQPQLQPSNNMAFNPNQQAHQPQQFAPQQQAPQQFAPQPQQQFAPQAPQANYSGNQQQAKKQYNIADLYWLLNINPNKTANEFEGITIGYNLDYDNIRLTFFNVNSVTLTDTQLMFSYQNRAGSANIYPEVAQEILHKLKHPTQEAQTINLLERTLYQTNWKPNKSSITIYSPTAVAFHTTTNTGQVLMFPLLQWQVNCLVSTIEFALTQATTAKLMVKGIAPPAPSQHSQQPY